MHSTTHGLQASAQGLELELQKALLMPSSAAATASSSLFSAFEAFSFEVSAGEVDTQPRRQRLAAEIDGLRAMRLE